MQNKICISSFNSTGFGLAAQQYIDTLLLFSDVVCIQEHFLLDSKDKKHSNTNKIRKKFSTNDMYIVPAFKDNNQISKGRGKGGLATIWNRKMTKYVSKIKCENFRLQATRFDFPKADLLIINTYFPCDPRADNFNDAELLKLLADIQTIIQQSDPSNIWISGDLNCHFSRNTRFTRLVYDYFEELGLKLVWECSDEFTRISKPSYTYMCNTNRVPSYSTIDHFACNSRLLPLIAEAGALQSGENPSNHSAIYAKLDIGDIDTSEEKVNVPKHVDWSAATEEAKAEYEVRLTEQLDHLAVPACVQCTDVHCSSHEHALDMEQYTMDILEAIETVSEDTLPVRGGSCKSRYIKSTAGWSEYVQPYQDESKFWHSLWVSAGKPNAGGLYESMKQARQQYKYAVRRLNRAGDSIKNDKLVNSIINGGVNIFSEIKKLRGHRATCSTRIDNEVGSDNISNYFADIYGDLYNRVPLSEQFHDLCTQLNMKVGQHSLMQVERINEDLVRKALKLMKSSKRDAMFDMQSDCLVNGPNALVTHLTNLVKTYVLHGTVPHFILLCTLLPLVKDNLADITSADNYRAIASGSLILKLLDLVILLLEGDKLDTDQLQFGFQPKSGTVMCTWTATAVIDFFNRKGNAVYGCAMDLSKAFDMVDWTELFLTLNKRNVDPIFLRVLLYIYRNQQCNVKWSSSYSKAFSVSNGVRQGAVSSPLLFSVYLNDLFTILREAGFGCYIGGYFMGCLGYADDLLLLSASRSGLQCMVDMCEKFTRKKNLKFSTNPNPDKSKTKCIVFSKKTKDLKDVAPIMLNNDPLPWVQQVKHLGNILQCDNSMNIDCTIKRGKFIGKVNSLLQEFHFADSKVKMKLINIYASSFYGSSLWDVFSSTCDKLYKSWNVAVRICFGVPVTTHRYLIEPLSGVPHAKSMLCSRLVNFTKQLKLCAKPAVNLLAMLYLGDRRTTLGKNISRMKAELEGTFLSSSNIRKNLRYFAIPEEENWRLIYLEELLALKDMKMTMENFTVEDTKLMLNALCTS